MSSKKIKRRPKKKRCDSKGNECEKPLYVNLVSEKMIRCSNCGWHKEKYSDKEFWVKGSRDFPENRS